MNQLIPGDVLEVMRKMDCIVYDLYELTEAENSMIFTKIQQYN